MADYGKDGSVENEQYCMPSWNKRNVDQMSQAMGYHDMGDLANTARPPTQMTAQKSNPQLGPKLPAPNSNDRKGKAY